MTPPGNISSQNSLPLEQSLIENILRLNKGKKVKIYASYPDSNEWRDRIYEGIIEQSGRDHIILSDPTNGVWEMLLMIYVDYISFDEPINYDPDFYPKDAEEQCELATLFNEVKIGISSDMMVASAGLDFNRYMALSVVYMDIDGWQKKLLVSAISQGSQKAVLMLQLVNAANGGNSAAPNEPIDFNKDYKPSLIQVEEVCDYCHGTGTVRTQSVTNYGGNAGQFTDEICPSCGGTGKIKRLRNNPDL